MIGLVVLYVKIAWDIRKNWTCGHVGGIGGWLVDMAFVAELLLWDILCCNVCTSRLRFLTINYLFFYFRFCLHFSG